MVSIRVIRRPIKNNALSDSYLMASIVFINRYFYPDHSATSQLVSDLAFDLVKSGMRVEVVTSRLSYDDSEIRFPSSEIVNGVRIHRVWTSSFGRTVLIGRMVDYMTFYLSALFCLLRVVRKNDVVVAKTDPPVISFIALLTCKLKRARLINWLQDVFPEVAIALGIRVPALAQKLLVSIRNMTLKCAIMNIVIGHRMKAYLESQSVDKNRIRVIYNWIVSSDIEHIPVDKNPLRIEWGLTDKFVVGYSGNLGRAHDVDTMLDTIRLARDDDICFLFIGGGAGMNQLKQAIEHEEINHVIFKPYQAIEKLGLSLGVPDVHLVTLAPELEGLIVPSKFYGVLASGKPTLFIGDRDGEVARDIEMNNCGITVRTGRPDILHEAIISYRDDTELLNTHGNNARLYFNKAHANSQSRKLWARLLQDCDR